MTDEDIIANLGQAVLIEWKKLPKATQLRLYKRCVDLSDADPRDAKRIKQYILWHQPENRPTLTPPPMNGTVGDSVKIMNKATQNETRRIGSRGGQARAQKLPPERRAEIARKAANRRWHPDEPE